MIITNYLDTIIESNTLNKETEYIEEITQEETNQIALENRILIDRITTQINKDHNLKKLNTIINKATNRNINRT